MLTSGIHNAHDTCAHLWPDRVHFIAPFLFGQSTHSGRKRKVQVRHSHDPEGIVVIP